MKYKNYKNSYSKDDRIYSKNELYDMTLREIFSRKEELNAQYRVLGLPDEKELGSSENVVHVEAYTREDGTEVKAHWRSKPNRGNSDNNISDANTQNAIKESSIEMDEQKKQEYIEKEREKSIIRKDPEEIAGVKRGEPKTFEEAGGKNVNPNFNSDKKGYKMNCSACAAVHKARQLGYDVEALPADITDKDVKMLQKYPYYVYTTESGLMEKPTKYRSDSEKEFIDNVENTVRLGETYILWHQPINGEEGIAHVVEVTRDSNNRLIFYDGQNGQTYDTNYAKNVKFLKIENGLKQYYPQYMFRTDDKLLKYDLMNKISRPSHRHSL